MRTNLLPLFVLLRLVWISATFSIRSSNFISKRTARAEINKMYPSKEIKMSSASPSISTGHTDAAVEAKEDIPINWRVRAKNFFQGLRITQIVPYVAAFFLGTLTATRRAAIGAPARTRIQQFPLLTAVLIAVGIRDTWSLLPAWLKSGLIRSQKEEQVDPNDLTSLRSISLKLQKLMNTMNKKLDSSANEGINVQASLLALVKVISQIKAQRAESRDQMYEHSGEPADPKQVMQGLDEAFEFADWAYDESPFGTLKENLRKCGFELLKHDKTDEPGYVGHYVAINKERNLALIGVKGTSNIGDMLTDCCGNAVSHSLEAPFVPGGNTTFRCHEGIFLSSERLANDIQSFVENLILPAGFDILITGHSLGAGASSLLALFLRSRIPLLQKDDGKRLKVLAFASPPVLDYDTAMACKPFTTTIVDNSDIITRASLSNLVVLGEVVTTMSKRMDERGMNLTTRAGRTAYMRMLRQGNDGEMLMSAEELREAIDDAYDKVPLRDPDHLFVPGNVIHMYDLWSKDGYGDEGVNAALKDPNVTARTAERVYLSDGASRVLRTIEIDSRLMSDHMSAIYRSSVKSLLAEPVEPVSSC